MDTQRRDRIVVGIDEGAQSALAVEWAAREAQAAGLPLALVHGETDRYAVAVIDPGIVPAMELAVRQSDPRRLVADTADVVHRIAPDIEVITHIEPGSPVGVLCRQAATATMVVLGSEGSGLFAELVFGSVCGTLAVRSRCPVVAVRAAPESVAFDAPVAVGVDGTSVSHAALAFAFDLADRHRVGVRAVHVMPASAGRDPDEQEKHRWRTADSMAALATQYPNVDIDLDFAIGEPVPILTARSAGCRLLVVGSRGLGGFRQLLLGSVSQQCAHHAECPVVIVRSKPARN